MLTLAAATVAFVILAMNTAHAADTCELRAKYAYIAAESARRMPLTLVLSGLQQHVQEHPEDWTTLDIQLAVRAMVFGYRFKDPDEAKALLNLFAISRNLERAGDLTKNIAEEIVFHIEAKVLKHKKDRAD